MKTIGIGEIQRNTSILGNLSESVEIVDKRQKKTVAVVYPVRTQSIVKRLAGKYRSFAKNKSPNLKEAKETAMTAAMEEKFGRAG
ncbi:MAG TPA: hypothetical protein ENK26_06535 [Gammaproteobacteria bacterium]|nr:hypothetical protein [Gammaproteobacteria bacterium]